jgi:DNA (cytosine-5)-methyltransferase 1
MVGGVASSAPTFVDLFAGCGGMTRGFVDAGFELAKGYELDVNAAATYAANFGVDQTECADVKELSDVPQVDVVIGGPPCQGFSNLGKRDPLDMRNRLWRSYVDVVVASGCDVFVFENVDRFAKSAEFSFLRAEARSDGRLPGWEVRGFNLNAADFGIPQRRVRSIVVGYRSGVPTAPAHTHAKDPTADPTLEPWRNVRDAIGHLPFDGLESALDDKRCFEFGDERAPGPFKLAELHLARHYKQISLDRYECVAPGRSRFDLPEDLKMDCWKRHTTGAADVLGRLEWDKPSVTIRTEFFKPEKGRYLHPEWSKDGLQVNRALTHAEAALLQSFDDQHLWCGSKVSIARQIGNAVPPALAAAIADHVLTHLEDGVAA